MTDYLRNPAEIYRRSFAAVRAETDLHDLPDGVADIVIRLVHASGMPDIVGDLAYSDDVAECGRRALAAGAPVIVDCQMLASGITRDRLLAGNEILCTLSEPSVPGMAERLKTTRSAAAVTLWIPRLDGAVVAIGNAPTALFRLIELLQDGAPRPAAILAFPVGFVGAAESKRALVDAGLGISFITLHGRRGGSAMAAAAVNALARKELS